jgi:hypothetical protein
VSVTQQLIDEVIAAGGSLRVPRRNWYERGEIDYEKRARLAERYGRVPVEKRLAVTVVSREELQIDLVDAYDETGRTREAIALGLARTGKLVTSAALVLMFAFFVLSTSPGTDIKQFGIGLAAGIIFDATVIRALLVPAVMVLMGRWNWWLPDWAARALRTRPSEPVPEARPVPESA